MKILEFRNSVHPLRNFIFFLGLVSSLGILSCSQSEKSTPSGLDQSMIDDMISGRTQHKPIPSLTATYGDFPLEKAYELQKAYSRQLEERLGDVVGFKVAYASRAAQEQFGIDEPASGPLFQIQRVPSGSSLNTGDFIGLVLETEVAFTIGKSIHKMVASLDELKSHVRWVHASFDIGDDRFDPERGSPGVSDMVASGTGAHFFILGPANQPGDVDLDGLVLKLSVDGEVVAESPASNVMGSPWNSLLWLVNQVVRRGDFLKPGDVVLTGTAAPAFKAKGTESAGFYEGDCGDLGTVTCTIR